MLKGTKGRKIGECPLEIEPGTPGLQGKWLIRYTTAAPYKISVYGELDVGTRVIKFCFVKMGYKSE